MDEDAASLNSSLSVRGISQEAPCSSGFVFSAIGKRMGAQHVKFPQFIVCTLDPTPTRMSAVFLEAEAGALEAPRVFRACLKTMADLHVQGCLRAGMQAHEKGRR